MRTNKGFRNFADRITVLAAAAAMLWIAIGCTQRRAPHAEGEMLRLRWAIAEDPEHLEWWRCRDVRCEQHVSLVMEGLSRLDFTDGKIRAQPALAIKWETSSGSEATFHLNPRARWTDGALLTAQHFVDSWRLAMQHCSSLSPSSPLMAIKNARAFCDGKVTFSRVGIEASDAHTLRVKLGSSHPNIALLFASPATWPYRGGVTPAPTLGPFILENWQRGKSMLYRRNPNYAGDMAQVGALEVKVVPSVPTRVQMFQDGEIDLADQLPPAAGAKLGGNGALYSQPILSIVVLGFNVARKPLHLVHLRRALVQAIDRQELADLSGGLEMPAARLTALPSSSGVIPKPTPDSAKKLLAGLKLELPQLRISDWRTLPLGDVAENLQAQWIKTLDLKVDTAMRNAALGMSVIDFSPDPYSPTHGLETLLNGHPSVADAFLRKAVNSVSPDEQEGWLAKAEDAMQAEALVYPLLYRARLALRRTGLKNVERTPLELWDFRRVTN